MKQEWFMFISLKKEINLLVYFSLVYNLKLFMLT